MIVLDTNVVSEVMRPAPNRVVLRWLNAQSGASLYLASVTLAELLFGIAARQVQVTLRKLPHCGVSTAIRIALPSVRKTRGASKGLRQRRLNLRPQQACPGVGRVCWVSDCGGRKWATCMKLPALRGRARRRRWGRLGW